MARKKRTCVLCGEPIKAADEFSTYRIEGDIKGFQRVIDMEKAFHNACVTKDAGVNEIARAQVLDYLEAVAFNTSELENLKTQNLDRAKRIMNEMRWRRKYDGESR